MGVIEPESVRLAEINPKQLTSLIDVEVLGVGLVDRLISELPPKEFIPRMLDRLNTEEDVTEEALLRLGDRCMLVQLPP